MSIVQIPSGISYDSNIFLVLGKSAIIVDAGTGQDSKNIIGRIWKALDGRRVSSIILTHCHVDHMGGAFDFYKEFGAPVYVGSKDLDAVRTADPRLTVSGLFGINIPPVEDCKPISENDIFDIGDHRLRVIETPGHTEGSICLYDEVTESLISGDTVFAMGFGRTDFIGGSDKEMECSLRKLLNTNICSLYPGHGDSASDGNRSVRIAIRMMESML